MNKEDNVITVQMELPDDICNIRFDPDDYGRVVMKSMKIYLDGVRQEKYTIVNGQKIGGDIYFGKLDPQIIIPLEGKKAKTLRIEYNVADLYECAGAVIEKVCGENYLLNQKIGQLNTLLQEIYESTSWRTTEIFRKIGRRIKKK